MENCLFMLANNENNKDLKEICENALLEYIITLTSKAKAHFGIS